MGKAIRITAGEVVLTAALHDNEASHDFFSMLPLSLNLKDFAATEKVADLPKRLSTAGTPPGYKPSIGDLTYYAPWGNLAIFYKSFGYSTGLVSLGRINEDIELLQGLENMKVTIEQHK
jgi:hypothetical protein